MTSDSVRGRSGFRNRRPRNRIERLREGAMSIDAFFQTEIESREISC
jgi:hypothetical protein